MKRIAALSLMSLLTACQQVPPQPLKTQLQVREYQTRVFDSNKTDEVMSAVVEAFQDQGFMVKNVVPQVGLIAASREVDLEDQDMAMFRRFLLGRDAKWEKNSTIEATANVKTQAGKTKVRLNFQEKVLNNHGGVDSIRIIEDLKFYQDFFDKVGKSIFIGNQKF